MANRFFGLSVPPTIAWPSTSFLEVFMVDSLDKRATMRYPSLMHKRQMLCGML